MAFPHKLLAVVLGCTLAFVVADVSDLHAAEQTFNAALLEHLTGIMGNVHPGTGYEAMGNLREFYHDMDVNQIPTFVQTAMKHEFGNHFPNPLTAAEIANLPAAQATRAAQLAYLCRRFFRVEVRKLQENIDECNFKTVQGLRERDKEKYDGSPDGPTWAYILAKNGVDAHAATLTAQQASAIADTASKPNCFYDFLAACAKGLSYCFGCCCGGDRFVQKNKYNRLPALAPTKGPAPKFDYGKLPTVPTDFDVDKAMAEMGITAKSKKTGGSCSVDARAVMFTIYTEYKEAKAAKASKKKFF